ncbi:DUF4139 domain-containing protein [Sulfitobacter porphyrae]|uniref:DUF4139 domain-containing protein n=1 Tax=Sulfitobacter porphyrae TaxID=1246864 RepID=A0ABW2B784_9RHOB
MSQLTLSVTAEAEAELTLSLSYPVDAGWRPVYDLYLRGQDPSTLEITRGAMIAQYSGENWEDVAVILSTLAPASQISPSIVAPVLRRIEEPEPPRPWPPCARKAAAWMQRHLSWNRRSGSTTVSRPPLTGRV